MKLTSLQVSNASATASPRKISDGGGLFLLIKPNGSKYWRLKYRLGGKERAHAIGVYPAITLKQARAERERIKLLISDGGDPAAERRADRIKRLEVDSDSFEFVAREFMAKKASEWRASYAATFAIRMERDAFPIIGRRPISELTAPEVLAMLRRIEDRGAHESASKVKQHCGQVFRYGVATGKTERDPTGDLRGALTTPKVRHYSTITDPKQVGALLRAIDGYSGSASTRAALQLAPYLFVRPGELRAAEWCEFDLDASEWRIPAERMKNGKSHYVPLCSQAVAILRNLQPLTGAQCYLFCSLRTVDRPLSENTLNAALRRMGYSKQEMTSHGFRSMASTLLNEQGYAPDVIERQLAHVERNKVRAAYNHAEYLPQRREMMQAWANYLDGLRAGGDVVAIHRAA